jgi:hypothetical protein
MSFPAKSGRRSQRSSLGYDGTQSSIDHRRSFAVKPPRYENSRFTRLPFAGMTHGRSTLRDGIAEPINGQTIAAP